jgi:fengycin family lipopeptide synthetase D
VEERLAAIWSELLGRERVGVTDNFFELGGDSIKVLRAASKINKAFSLKLPVRALFKFNNISELARYIALSLKPVQEASSAEFDIIDI